MPIPKPTGLTRASRSVRMKRTVVTALVFVAGTAGVAQAARDVKIAAAARHRSREARASSFTTDSGIAVRSALRMSDDPPRAIASSRPLVPGQFQEKAETLAHFDFLASCEQVARPKANAHEVSSNSQEAVTHK